MKKTDIRLIAGILVGIILTLSGLNLYTFFTTDQDAEFLLINSEDYEYYETISGDFLLVKDENDTAVSVSGKYMKINVQYDSSCSEHGFGLIWNGEILESSPSQITFYLTHSARHPESGACDDVVNETLVFDITPLYQGSFKKGDSISIGISAINEQRDSILL